MIQANELRMGNWVDTIGGFQWIDYIGVDATLSDGDIREYVDLLPIPLTPEILEKAGFKFDGTDELGGWNKYVNWAIQVWQGEGGIQFKHGNTVTILHSLHDLQNLYFALTGQELEIKL